MRLLAERVRFLAGPGADSPRQELARHLLPVLADIRPACLGLYWPIRSEFNASSGLLAAPELARVAFALPYVRRMPVEMHYRAWNREPPTLRDEAGIPASDGAPVVPDVVLVPCVGFTPAGFRLGYGGGYFDRWLAAYPHVTAIGVAWSIAQLDARAFEPKPHDRPMTLIVTERGVV